MKIAELEAGGYQETSVRGLIIFSMVGHMRVSNTASKDLIYDISGKL